MKWTLTPAILYIVTAILRGAKAAEEVDWLAYTAVMGLTLYSFAIMGALATIDNE
jgi:hypothetical protein